MLVAFQFGFKKKNRFLKWRTRRRRKRHSQYREQYKVGIKKENTGQSLALAVAEATWSWLMKLKKYVLVNSERTLRVYQRVELLACFGKLFALISSWNNFIFP